MGTDITVAIGHTLKFPPPLSLSKEMSFGIVYENSFFKQEWSWDEQFNNEKTFRLIRATNGPMVWIGQKAALITTGVGWDQVADNMALRKQFLSNIFSIGNFFNSPCAVFMPDDVEPWCNIKDLIFTSRLTLDGLIGMLHAISDPSLDFASVIRHDRGYVVDGYFIEKLSK